MSALAAASVIPFIALKFEQHLADLSTNSNLDDFKESLCMLGEAAELASFSTEWFVRFPPGTQSQRLTPLVERISQIIDLKQDKEDFYKEASSLLLAFEIKYSPKRDKPGQGFNENAFNQHVERLKHYQTLTNVKVSVFMLNSAEILDKLKDWVIFVERDPVIPTFIPSPLNRFFPLSYFVEKLTVAINSTISNPDFHAKATDILNTFTKAHSSSVVGLPSFPSLSSVDSDLFDAAHFRDIIDEIKTHARLSDINEAFELLKKNAIRTERGWVVFLEKKHSEPLTSFIKELSKAIELHKQPEEDGTFYAIAKKSLDRFKRTYQE